jgi:mycoredoxin-dependent peroxiredoxin
MGTARRWALAAGVLVCGTAIVLVLRPHSSAPRAGASPGHEIALSQLVPASPGLPIERPLPSLVLQDDSGARVALADLRGKPAWLVFFRGVYCPSCRAQLTALAERAGAIESSGVQLVAVSPDPPQALARLRAELGLRFRLLSDETEAAVAALCGGLAHCQLLVDAGGTIRWGAFSESWSQASPPDTVLRAALDLR